MIFFPLYLIMGFFVTKKEKEKENCNVKNDFGDYFGYRSPLVQNAAYFCTPSVYVLQP